MSVSDLAEAIRRHINRSVTAGMPVGELGTITESGLQLDNFAHLIPTWFGDVGSTIPVGARVVAVPLGDGSEFYVRGPVERKGAP